MVNKSLLNIVVELIDRFDRSGEKMRRIEIMIFFRFLRKNSVVEMRVGFLK